MSDEGLQENTGWEAAVTALITGNNGRSSALSACVTWPRLAAAGKPSLLKAGTLTRSLVPVGLGGDVVLHVARLQPSHLLHLVDLRHAQLGVVMEKQASLQDGQLVFGPIPQLPQILVVQRVERVVSGEGDGDVT